ncbi:hypothetical protein KO489_10405 [Reinekea forsetii]|nr:hypothetical protein [Reinekea forsetii]
MKLKFGLFIVSLMLSLPVFASDVFIVQSYNIEYEWDAEYVESVQRVLGAEHNYTIRELDSKRKQPEQWKETARQVVEEIKQVQPDIVIVGDDNAMSSVAVALNGSTIPVVFLGVNGTLQDYGVQGSANITGVLERPFFEQSVRHLRKVTDNNSRFLVLMDDSITMRNAVSETYGDQRTATVQNTQVDFFLSNSAEQWKERARSAKDDGYDAIIIGTYHTLRYADDTYFPPADAIAFLRETSVIPVFSFWNIFIGADKAIGGYSITAYEEGKAAARMAQLILRGVSINKVPPITSISGQYVYSKQGLEKWGVKLTTLTRSQAVFVE